MASLHLHGFSGPDKLNGESESHAASSQRAEGYSHRHPHRGNISINTATQLQPGRQSSGELTAPGTAYDMNYTPLLPSQLLLGSPLQTTAPQFANFAPFPADTTVAAMQQQQPPLLGQDSQPSGFSDSAYSAVGNQHASNQDHNFASVQQIPLPATMSNAASRSIYLGNVPPDTSAEELLNHVRSGQIESVRLLPDKNCAFIAFLDGSSATHFHSDAILKKLTIRGHDIKVGWGKTSTVPAAVAMAVHQHGASRNVFLGNLPETTTEGELREDLGQYGPIDTVKIVREKNIGFVHFLSISNALRAVANLPQEPKWQPPRRVYYGKDRCAYVSKTQQQNAAQYLGIAPGYAHMLNNADRDLISNALAQQSVAAAAVATQAGGVGNLGNRTVYLGNVHPETTIEEICNVVRGGLLHHVRYLPDKHICFVTFVDPTAAASFFALSNVQGLMIHNRRLKIGWGKHSGGLPPAIALAVSGGASRNVYVGNLSESWTEEKLRQDFSEYGEIELVNTLREKNCAFVNFTNIANAIKAIEAVRSRPDYGMLKVNFGKDRCGNAPRQNQPQDHHQQPQQHFPHPDTRSHSPLAQSTTNHSQHFLGQQQQQPAFSAQQHSAMGLHPGLTPQNYMTRTSTPANQYDSASYYANSIAPTRQNLTPVPSYGSSEAVTHSRSQSRHGHTPSSVLNSTTANPLALYLSQLSLQEPNTAQRQHLHPEPYPTQQVVNGQVYASDIRPQQSGHANSLSQSGLGSINVMPPSNEGSRHNASSSTIVGGFLAPRNQHSRAVSLPAFYQDNLSQPMSRQIDQLDPAHDRGRVALASAGMQAAGGDSTAAVSGSLLPLPIGHRQQQASVGSFGGLGGGSTWGLNPR